MKKHFYFVRHGETIGNRLSRHQSRSTPLTEIGERQAINVARALSKKRVELIITSGALRTQQTALPLLETVHAPVLSSPLFEEYRRPSVIIGKRHFSFSSIFTLLRAYIHAGNPNWHHSDEENFTQFFTRAKDAILFLAEQNTSYVVIVSHRLFIAAVLSVIAGNNRISVRTFLTFLHFQKIPNGSITELLYDTDSSPHWSVVSNTDTPNLGGV